MEGELTVKKVVRSRGNALQTDMPHMYWVDILWMKQEI